MEAAPRVGEDEAAGQRAGIARLCRHLAARDLAADFQRRAAADGKRTPQGLECADLLGQDAAANHSSFDDAVGQFSTAVLMEALEISCIRLEIMPPRVRRELLEKYESTAAAADTPSAQMYAKMVPVLWKLPKDSQPAVSAICSMLRSCRPGARDMAADWAGLFLLLGISHADAARSYREVQVAQSVMRVLIEHHEAEAEEGALLISPPSSVAGDSPSFHTEASETHERSAAAERPITPDHGGSSSKKKSSIGRFASMLRSTVRGRGSSNAASSAAKSSAGKQARTPAPSEVPETHKLSAADHASLSAKPAQTAKALAERYGRAPPPPPPEILGPGTALQGSSFQPPRRRHSSLGAREASGSQREEQQHRHQAAQQGASRRNASASSSSSSSSRRRSLSQSDVNKIKANADLSGSELSIL